MTYGSVVPEADSEICIADLACPAQRELCAHRVRCGPSNDESGNDFRHEGSFPMFAGRARLSLPVVALIPNLPLHPELILRLIFNVQTAAVRCYSRQRRS